MADVGDAWEAFLNPELVRTKLISAGLFLIGHEMLLESVKRHPRSFFSDTWTVDGPQVGEKYRQKILALDPKGKDDAFRGSIAWLRKMEAISGEDEAAIKVLNDVRNEVAHEMMAMLSGAEPLHLASHFTTLMALIQKIEKWWILNVEIGANPDFDGVEIDEDGIVSGPSWAMQLLAKVALGEDYEAWEFHQEFVRQRAQGAAK